MKKVVRHLPEQVSETSGLLYINGNVFTHNDSGGEPILYQIDLNTGEVIRKIRINNAINVDWEDLTCDQTHVYIGDFGNNAGNRTTLQIYKVDIPAFKESTTDTIITAEKIEYTYPNYQAGKYEVHKHNFDCEAIVSKGDSLYLFSKNWKDKRCNLYALPKKAGFYKARFISSLKTKGLITGACLDTLENRLMLVGYKKHGLSPFFVYLYDYKSTNFFSGYYQRLRMPFIIKQTESIVQVDKGKYLISNEEVKKGGVRLSKSRIYELKIKTD